MAQTHDWFKFNSDIVLKDKATIFALKNSPAQVLYQKNKVAPVFQDLKRETQHHCRLLSKRMQGSFQMVKQKNIHYCLIDSTNTMLMIKGEGKSRTLHNFQFSNTSHEERKTFINSVGLSQ